jgi:hypothetical protein
VKKYLILFNLKTLKDNCLKFNNKFITMKYIINNKIMVIIIIIFINNKITCLNNKILILIIYNNYIFYKKIEIKIYNKLITKFIIKFNMIIRINYSWTYKHK